MLKQAAHTDDPMYLTGCMRRVLVRPGQLRRAVQSLGFQCPALNQQRGLFDQPKTERTAKTRLDTENCKLLTLAFSPQLVPGAELGHSGLRLAGPTGDEGGHSACVCTTEILQRSGLPQ